VSFVKDKINDLMRERRTVTSEPTQLLRLIHAKAELVMTRTVRINEGLHVAKRETDKKQVFLYTWLGLYAAAVDASERKQLLLQLQRNANDRFVIVLQLVRYWGS